METRKILTILVLASGLMVWPVAVSQAAPMGTAFTYQGRLIDSNDAADGLYDLQFKLFDTASGPNQVAGDVNKADVHVIDGYFAVDLDFGSEVFDGDARWLQIGARPGDQNDPNFYTVLEPRQELTPVPYALQIRGIFVNDAGNVGIGTTSTLARLHLSDPCSVELLIEADTDNANETDHPSITLSQDGGAVQGKVGFFDGDNTFYIYNTYGADLRLGAGNNRDLVAIKASGRVGINTTSPNEQLHVKGPSFLQTIFESTDSAGGIRLIADTGQSYELQALPNDHSISDGFIVYDRTDGAYRIVIDTDGNVGIGDTSPDAKVDILNTGSGASFRVDDSVDDDATPFIIDHMGRVGIGTTSPSVKLEIRDDANDAYVNVSGQDDGKSVYNLHGGLAYIWYDEAEGEVRLWNAVTGGNAGFLSFGTSNAPRMTIDRDGKVGIGTTTPAYDLDVIGNIRATGSVYYGGTEGNANGTAYNKPDYVFEKGYDVMSIEQVEEYLKKENHLPWMTSAKKEKEENGNVIDMTRMAFETVETAENLQIQIIELDKLIKEHAALIKAQQKRITALEEEVASMGNTAQPLLKGKEF